MTPPASVRHLVLVAGLSGAGKSSALKFLEDLGFSWVDNLPYRLLGGFLDHFPREGEVVTRVAIGIHFRDEAGVAEFLGGFRQLAERAERLDLVFLEADFDRLVSRYRETRRRHPLAHCHTVREAISLEAVRLADIRALADHIIDTSTMTVPELKDRLDLLFHEGVGSDLVIFIRSFGFKHGTNTDADMVLDGRFLVNPYYDPELRHRTGLDEAVVHYLEKDGEALIFLDRLQALFDYLIPRYRREKKRYFTVDIGCTGGCHRSVYLVERLAGRLTAQGFRVLIRHRDVFRKEGGQCS
ncbi:MAG: RNase adapter RapZ [Magnetococcales bacterium]|nr:RNase adapter RapZ [Magnetococcales bacterium]MBF0156812.1 RNase adapter RapZ [Magnetococcales bacterium]